MTIFKSAAKIAFLLLTLTACVGFMLGKLPVESFMVLASGAFAFFFANKSNNKENLPYNGK